MYLKKVCYREISHDLLNVARTVTIYEHAKLKSEKLKYALSIPRNLMQVPRLVFSFKLNELLAAFRDQNTSPTKHNTNIRHRYLYLNSHQPAHELEIGTPRNEPIQNRVRSFFFS